MSAGSEEEGARFIWATRGRSWGFRFLRSGGYEDPLSVYESAFAEIRDRAEGWCGTSGAVALRFPDPERRRDAAGRVIPHDFVLFGPRAEGIKSVDDGRQRIWPEVADEFGRIWDRDDPSSGQSDLR